MSVRLELPWEDIKSEVVAAIDTMNQQRPFVNVKVIAEHISNNPDVYPVIHKRVRNLTRDRTIRGRTTMAIEKMQWPRFSARSRKGGGVVYVDIRHRE